MKTITYNDLTQIPQVPSTPSWNPIHHTKIVDAVTAIVGRTGIKDMRLDVDKTGMNMFGRVLLDNAGIDSQERDLMLGFRNSMNKRFAIGITAGVSVIVCSNMMFKGDIYEFRKHTGRLLYDDVVHRVGNVYDAVIENGQRMEQWQLGLREKILKPEHVKCAVFDLLNEGALPPSSFGVFKNHYLEEYKLHGNSLYTLHGAAIRAIRDRSLTKIAEYTPRIERKIRVYEQLAIAA